MREEDVAEVELMMVYRWVRSKSVYRREIYRLKCKRCLFERRTLPSWGVAELFLLLRRHFAHFDLLQCIFPEVGLFLNVRGFEIEVAFLLFRRMAIEAVALQK